MKKTSMKKPMVSVIIPVFNGASFLTEAVSSVQKSKFKQFEILLVNDGSTDESKMLCQKLAKKYRNVRFFDFEKNRGLSRVLNFALAKARGKYICRLNQDDRMLPHRIATQVNYLDIHPEVVALGSCINLFDDYGNHQIVKYLEKDKDIKDIWYLISPFADPSVMYRKDIALKAGGYDQGMWPADDTHLWYRMGLLGQLANLQKPVVDVRWHDKAASVYHFKRLALSTYKMHMWTHTHIKPASWYIHLFWLVQLLAGMTLSPQFNWNTYRRMKKVINAYEERKTDFFAMPIIRNTLTAVNIQPAIAIRSGK